MTDDINIKAWEHCSTIYIKENNKIFQEKQVDLIKSVALREGIEIKTAEINDNAQVVLDFDIDFVESWHCDFFRCVEAIMSAQNDSELNNIKDELRGKKLK